MGKLSSAIVQRKLASLRDVEEALARQVLYGGDLATNLLEQAPTMDERALTDLLAEIHALPAAPAGELPRSLAEARLLVPGDVALRHGLYPLEQANGTLVVAVAEPLEPETEQDLGFGLGVAIAQRVAPLVRIRQAISRDYAMPLDRRSLRVLARLDGRPDPSPSVAPAPLASAPDMASFPRPPSIPPLGLPMPMDMSPLYAPGARERSHAAPGLRAPSHAAPRPDPVPSPEPPAAVMPAVAILPMAPLGVVAIAEPANGAVPLTSPEPTPDRVSIHERLTSPAPPVAPNRDEETMPWPIVSMPGPVPASASGAASADGSLAARVTALAPPQSSPAALPSVPSAASVPTTSASEGAVSAPAQAQPRRTGSGQFAIPAAALAAWSAENKGAADRRRAHARHRGPYTTAAAEQDLLGAEGRDDVLNAFFSFACQFFEYAALFAVHGDLAEGRDASGPGADHAAVTGIGVPLDLPGALRTVRNEGRFNVVALAEDGLDARVAADLLRKTGRKVLLLPIRVRERTVLIFYGDNGDQDVELPEIGDVIAFAPLVAAALENVILKKKSAVRKAVTEAERSESLPTSVRPAFRRRSLLPSRGERVEALTEALQSTVRPLSEPPSHKRAIIPEPAPRPATPAQGTPRHASVPPPPVQDATATPGPVFSLSKRPSTPPSKPSAGPEKAPPSANPPAPAAAVLPSLPSSLSSPSPSSASSASLASLPSLPSLPSLDEGPEISVGTAEEDWSPDPPEPDSRVVVATQLPIKRYSSAELKLPTVIVNVDADIEVLVRRLIGGDESTIDRLAQLGATAASRLVAHFPGPTRPDSDRLGAPEPASNRGPLLKALARIGQPAVPFVAVRTSDADATIRVLSTLLLGEIPSSDSAHFVARRVTDRAAEVRRAAFEAGRQLQADEDARTTLRDKVSSFAEDKTSDIEARVAAIEALAHFRDTRTVPRLIRLVPLDDEVGQSAQWALGVITRQAFGRDTATWETWWAAHSDEHRIVWLIDALMHDDPENRRAAGEELKALTKEYFGYYDDLSRKEREKAQRRYREWWEATGKARFGG